MGDGDTLGDGDSFDGRNGGIPTPPQRARSLSRRKRRLLVGGCRLCVDVAVQLFVAAFVGTPTVAWVCVDPKRSRCPVGHVVGVGDGIPRVAVFVCVLADHYRSGGAVVSAVCFFVCSDLSGDVVGFVEREFAGVDAVAGLFTATSIAGTL